MKFEKDDSRKEYLKLEKAVTSEEIKQAIEGSRVFLQQKFRELQPSQLAEDLRVFWEEGGSEMLSEWFEWLSGGTELSSLSQMVMQQLTKVLYVVENNSFCLRGETIL